jgi:adenosylmethionine-8-amino-7-oxononanoate aminotransferase
MRLADRDRKRLVRNEPAKPLAVAAARGHYVTGADRRRYLDFQMGWCVGILGWGDPDIEAEMRGFRGPDYVMPDLLYEPWVELADLLVSLAPRGLTRCMRATGGSEAVEFALQAALLCTKRSKLVAIEGCYHGDSIATLSLGDSGHKLPNALRNCRRLAPPLDESAIGRLETLLKGNDVAAFVMEPIVTALGVHVPAPAFMAAAQRLCRRHGTLFVADEVATGFGHTGRMFACEHYALRPDILCCAKAITGGYGGLGATLLTERVARKVARDVEAYSTFGWHPRAVHASLATLRKLAAVRSELLRNVVETGDYLRRELARLPWRRKPRIRGVGLLIGVDTGSAKAASRIADRAREAGLLLSASDATLLLMPALHLDRRTAREALRRLAASL